MVTVRGLLSCTQIYYRNGRNDNNQDMNILIGEEFMINLFELDNKYATLYLEKKSSFFLEK